MPRRVLKASTTRDRAPAPTADELQQLQLALDDAYNAGLAAGRADADRNSASMQQVSERLIDLTDCERSARRDALRADTTEVVETALDVASWICGAALHEPRAVADRVVELTADLPEPVVAVHVHPSIAQELDGHDVGAVVSADPSLQPGDIVIATDGPELRLVIAEAIDHARPVVSSYLSEVGR